MSPLFTLDRPAKTNQRSPGCQASTTLTPLWGKGDQYPTAGGIIFNSIARSPRDMPCPFTAQYHKLFSFTYITYFFTSVPPKNIPAKNLLIQAITRIIDYLTYGFIITFSEIPNAFLNKSRSVRITICFEQNIHGYTPGYKRLEKAPLIKPQESKRESL